MNHRHFLARLIAAAVCLSAIFASAAEKPQGYDAFELIRTRNIFDPNRRAVKKESEQTRAVAPSRPRSVHLALTGTMVTDGRALAFFSGSRSEFNKIVKVGEKIGDFTVAAISAGQVDLKQGETPTVLAVGNRLQLEGTEADAAEPEPTPTDATPVAASPTSSTGTATPSAAPPPAPGNASEILKRMMERRAQEMKK